MCRGRPRNALPVDVDAVKSKHGDELDDGLDKTDIESQFASDVEGMGRTLVVKVQVNNAVPEFEIVREIVVNYLLL